MLLIKIIRRYFRFFKRLWLSLYLKLINRNVSLPADFSLENYLFLNPDVRDSGVDGVQHYLNYGHREKRIYHFKICKSHNGRKLKNHSNPNILIVVHELSVTGAPILALNIAKYLSCKFNIYILSLSPKQSLISEAKQFSIETFTLDALPGDRNAVELAVRELTSNFNFKAALVNSVEARYVLPVLNNLRIPAISLIHEFASYTKPTGAIAEAIFWSNKCYFSSYATIRDAANEIGVDVQDFRNISLLRQGKIDIELKNDSILFSDQEVLDYIASEKIAGKKIILCAGTVQMRKGTDLFLQISALMEFVSPNTYSFIWITPERNFKEDIHFGHFVAEQLNNLNYVSHLKIVGPVANLDKVIEQSDLFLLTSRMDPLPNVGIDAISNGTPILCLRGSGGIPELLEEFDLADFCILSDLNFEEISRKINLLTHDYYVIKKVKHSLSQIAKNLSMSRYADEIFYYIQQVERDFQIEINEIEGIYKANEFRHDFSTHKIHINSSKYEQINNYVRGWKSGIQRRKPIPGFHPLIYVDHHIEMQANEDAFAHYIYNRKPLGPWVNKVINELHLSEYELKQLSNSAVALHIHVHYPDLLIKIISALNFNLIRPDIFITLTREKDADLVSRICNGYLGKVQSINVVKNFGRDILPFLALAKEDEFFQNYDFIGHIHTKKSKRIKDELIGKEWFAFLVQNLLGDGCSTRMMDTILYEMSKFESLGIVFPDDPNVLGWASNLKISEAIIENKFSLPANFNYPVGFMFWISSKLLGSILELNINFELLQEEPLPDDGTILHAIERLFGVLPLEYGYEIATTNVEGITR